MLGLNLYNVLHRVKRSFPHQLELVVQIGTFTFNSMLVKYFMRDRVKLDGSTMEELHFNSMLIEYLMNDGMIPM